MCSNFCAANALLVHLPVYNGVVRACSLLRLIWSMFDSQVSSDCCIAVRACSLSRRSTRDLVREDIPLEAEGDQSDASRLNASTA